MKVNRMGRRGEIERYMRKVYRSLYRPFRSLVLWGMRRYLRWAGGATRDGILGGGYIVAMTPSQYHHYTLLVRDANAQQMHQIIWTLRENGVEV